MRTLGDIAFISIHAPYEGGDMADLLHNEIHKKFQSTPPMKGATNNFKKSAVTTVFQSTPPMKGATSTVGRFRCFNIISIHAPYEGGDLSIPLRNSTKKIFQSTPPMKGATRRSKKLSAGLRFQSTPPMKGATSLSANSGSIGVFQSTPPMKGATAEKGQKCNSPSNIHENANSNVTFSPMFIYILTYLPRIFKKKTYIEVK